MSRVLKGIFAGLASLAVLPVLAVAVALLIPDDNYRRWLTEAVFASTGRELRVDGEFQIDAGSRLQVHATEVRFANPPWASEPFMLTIDRIDAELRLLSLLGGVVDFVLDVGTPKVFLETDAEGRGNWQASGVTEPDEIEPSPETPVSLGFELAPTVRLANGQLRFVHGESGRTQQFDMARVELGVPASRLTATLEGRYLGQPATLSADFGSVGRIVAGETVDVRLDAALGEIVLAVAGSLSRPSDPAGPIVDLTLGLDVPSTASVEVFTGARLPELGALELRGRVMGANGEFAAEEIEVRLTGPAVQASAKGRIGNLTALQGMAFKAEVASDAVPEIIDTIGLALPGTLPKSLNAEGEFGGGLDGLSVTNLSVRSFEGEVAAELRGSAEDLLSQRGFVADVRVTAPSLAALSAYAGRELPESGRIRAESHVVSTGKTYEISRIDLKMEGDVLSGELSGSVADLFALGGANLSLNAKIGSLRHFSAVAGVPLPETAPLRIETGIVSREGIDGPAKLSTILDSDWLRGKVEATVADVLAGQGLDASLDLELQSLAVLSGFAGRELPPMGPLKASGKLTSVGESYRLADLDVGIEDPALKARLTGSIGNLLNVSGIDVTVDSQIGSLSNFSKIAGKDLPLTKPLSVKARAVADEGAEGVAKVSAKVESVWLNGNVEAMVADLRVPSGVEVAVRFALQSLADLSSTAARDLPAIGPVEVSARLESEGESIAVSKLNIAVEDGPLRAKLTGSVGDAMSLKGTKLALEAAVDSVSSLSSLVGQQLPATPPVSLTTQVTASGGLEGPIDVLAKVQSDRVRLHARGTIADVSQADQTQVDISVDAESLAALANLAGTALGEVGPVALTTTLGASAQEINLAALKVQVGRSDLSGDLKLVLPSVNSAGRVSGVFKSKLLDVLELRAAGGNPEAPTTAAGNDPTLSPDGRVFSDVPLPLELLTRYNGSVDVVADQVRFRDLTAEKGQLAVRLEDGNLQVGPARAWVEGRPLRASAELDAAKRPSPFALTLEADKVPLTNLLREGAYLQGGEIYVDIDVQSAGNSVREMMAGLNGYLSLALRNTRLAGTALEFIGQDLLSQLNPLSASKGYSELECSAVTLDIASGLATMPRGLISRNTSATWMGDGQIDFKDETLHVTVRSKPRTGLGIGLGKLASLLQLTGTLANPIVRPDPVGVAKTGLEAALAFTTFGTSLLATSLFDRATSGGGVCEEILELVILGTDPREGAGSAGDKGDSDASEGSASDPDRSNR